MKIIELLNRIANGEEVPKKIKYNNEIFTIREEKDDYANQNCWFTDRFSFLELNEEVEIIEEEQEDKKIEMLKWTSCVTCLEEVDKNIDELKDKINEIIDKINKD